VHPLSSICQQLHTETALLPFLLGTIVLNNIETLAELDGRLSTSQRSAIQHLRLITPLGYSNIVPLFMRKSRRQRMGMRDYLPGLQMVEVEIVKSYTERHACFRGWSPRCQRRRERFEEWLMAGRGREVEVWFCGWGQEGSG